MSRFINNPFGSDALDIREYSAAERVGDRIRIIRTARGLSQAELAAKVGLTADRIQKYENGARKPKSELLKSIASALGVSSLALVDPTTSSYINAMYVLFELENKYDLKIEKIGEGRDSRICLSANPRDGFYSYLEDWYEEYSRLKVELEIASSEEEKAELIKEYQFWKWSYPKLLADKTDQNLRKARLQETIKELQAELDKIK